MCRSRFKGGALADSFALVLTTASLLLVQQLHGSTEADLLPGWQGEMIRNPELFYDPLNLTLPDHIPLPASRGWVEHISDTPRAYIFHNFVTDKEAKHLIELAWPQMKRSTVVGEGGKSVEDDYRTSYGTFLRRYQDDVMTRIENRVAAWTKIPVVNQEDTQVLRYAVGQYYKVHGDNLVDDQAGARVATVLIYLNDAEFGGETAFPDSEWIDPSLETKYGKSFSECAKGHVAFKPKRGDALLFWSIKPDGRTEDPHAMHTGCPVVRGHKWTATKWIHAKPFRPQELESSLRMRNRPVQVDDPGVCRDLSIECKKWAARGDCERNHDFMVVGPTSAGHCRAACGACKVCKDGDKACYDENRRAVGFLIFNATELSFDD